MSDSAVGPSSGYLFQFEKALALLSNLDGANDIVSIELVDDVAIQDENGLILMSVQSKHSVSPNGTTFEDTSHALWRTIQIWIEKLEQGIFNNDTRFICSTNKKIDSNYLLRKIQNKDLPDVIKEIKELLKVQQKKLKEATTSGKSIKNTIKLIKFALSKTKEFSIVKRNLEVNDEESLMEKFYVGVNMITDEYSEVRKKAAFEEMYGWIVQNSKAKWLNGSTATFTKKDFDTRLSFVNNNPSIVNAVFRKKNLLGSISETSFEAKKKELFVAQIEDISRNERAKTRKIEKAIQDFIYHDIEMTYIITTGNFTEEDRESFKKTCKEKWQTCFDSHVLKELDEYNSDEKNEIALRIFDTIMDNIQVEFQDGFKFNSSNSYVQNGTFLHLSNTPEIGWHPEWEFKYKTGG